MKGSRRFSKESAAEIRRLLGAVRRAEPPQQKGLRQRIRDLGFFISDFNRPASGFTPGDFDDLVAAGQIEVE
jgi:hypothetical protein